MCPHCGENRPIEYRIRSQEPGLLNIDVCGPCGRMAEKMNKGAGVGYMNIERINDVIGEYPRPSLTGEL